MSMTLRYSEIDGSKKNKTFKRKFTPPLVEPNEVMKPGKTEKVENFLNSMEEGDDNLANFNPLESENSCLPVNSSGLPDNISTENYYKQYIPYYTGASDTKNAPNDELLEKLNYMVHLLEEQKDEKTDNVTEELVLYLFLGVFVIFVTDSFARAGKYTR